MQLESLDSLDLARHVRPGDGVIFQQGCGEALSVAERFVQQRASYSGARLFLGSGFSCSFQPEHADHLRFSGIGGIGSLRKLASARALDPIPCHISSIEPLLRQGVIASDVVMLQVSPPNERGEYSLGLVNDYVRTAIGRARVVIAEINRQIPWVHCDLPLTAADISVAVETDRAPLELPPAPFGALEQRIAQHIGDLIGDRSTLQMGIGSVPEAIMSSLADRRELGIHSGMIGDSAVTLMECGAVTNAHKGMDAGVTVSGVLFGTQKLYRYAERNPQIRLHPTSYTHHIGVLARLKNFVSINSALEVDLTGQINAEAIGREHIGAVGGQVDYIRAAALSEGGVSIVALPATGKGGDSKIVSRLSGPVTTARSDVDVVATEHGVAHLRGRSLRQRVRALVQIAAPEHRERLLAEARQVLGENV